MCLPRTFPSVLTISPLLGRKLELASRNLPNVKVILPSNINVKDILEIVNEDNHYGTVKGLFTLQLLKAVPGEGGGFVYASINENLGDFICETPFVKGEAKPMPVVDDVSGIDSLNNFTYYVWYIQGKIINYNL